MTYLQEKEETGISLKDSWILKRSGTLANERVTAKIILAMFASDWEK
jgi:hypothetical protein